MSASPATVSLKEMLEINGQSFMAAVTEMRRVKTMVSETGTVETWREVIPPDTRPIAIGHVDNMVQAVGTLHAQAAHISALRLRDHLENNETLTWKQLADALADIESRLNDELGLVKLFVLSQEQSVYLLPGSALVGQRVADQFPSIMFEVEEAAKCHALGRCTASVFHSMRALEAAIRAMAKFLEIPDPTAPVERNWGFILKAIKEKIDGKYPAKTRMSHSEGADVEALFQSLDAIKNPLRNATMHVENTYQPHESSHILQCLNVFLGKLAGLCDENGLPPIA